MKKTIGIFMAVFLTAVLLTGCLSSGGNTVSVKCVTGLDVTEPKYGMKKQLRMEFDETTGVLTAEADGVLVEYAFNRNGDLRSWIVRTRPWRMSSSSSCWTNIRFTIHAFWRC